MAQFFSGFSLKDEAYLFQPYIKNSEYAVCGFSYGAIKAFEAVQQSLKESKRVDTLQLFSPAFFQTKDEKFKRLQLMSYKKNKEVYLQNFLDSCFAPYEKKIVKTNDTDTIDDLQTLLEYEWDLESLQKIVDAGVVIEVYLGFEDKIIDPHGAYQFFRQVANVTSIKRANHFLQMN
ncbi:pimelyl-ACP methyl ester esterase BioV [Sulfurimonas sp. C5]|uniref:pimelyl-ACP methyl ester esterase BioV n=1 Tax=Sulfurimonas sp. C5 TaxID=3036947 RepID=UPI0024543F2D|nr:pimelyl-ACP methyl ester esterase BioV [Sulfurimonas sp. C5]MDH4943811.1 pimelyl-ACP methyl ester esterase BioV [Sulfurimonas sp. C5]